MVAYNNATNDYGTSRLIVSSTAGFGNYTTIAAATAAATSGQCICILPGTYTENITLKAGVNYAAWGATGEYDTPTVSITGKFIDNGVAVNCTFENISLNTNSDYVISLTAASTVSFVNCDITAVTTAAINLANAGSNVYLYQCTTGISSTGFSLWSITSGDLWMYECQGTNFGTSTTGPTSSGGGVSIYNSEINFPLASTATQYTLNNVIINTSSTNTACLTMSGTAFAYARYCTMSSGTASCVVAGSGTGFVSDYNTMITSNTYAVAS